MLGLLLIIVVSWVLLYFIEKKNIEVLGIIPYPKRVFQFLIGMLFMMLICLLWIYIESIVLNIEWQLKSDINYALIFESFIFHIRSALTEDVVFRGALLYILLQRIGVKWGMLISAIIFGIYHVFSYGMIGDRIVAIVYVVLITGVTGYIWAYSFYKTKSIMLALGFHLGYNFLMTLFYDSVPYGELIFQEVARIDLRDWDWLYFNLFKGMFPSFMTLVFVMLLLKYNVKIFQIKSKS